MSETAAPAPARRLGEHGGVTKGGVEMDATSARHMVLIDQMIAWQIANPGKPWSHCAQAMGLTPLWCRMVASTDAFRARYAEVAPELIEQIGLVPLKAKMSAVAEMALERLAEKIPLTESLGDLTDATEMLIQGIYGKQGGSGDAPAPTSLTLNQQIILEQGARLQGLEVAPAPAPALPSEEPKE